MILDAQTLQSTVGALAAEVQTLTGGSVELAWVDQGYTGVEPAEAAADHGVTLEVVQTAGEPARLRAVAPPVGGSLWRMNGASPGRHGSGGSCTISSVCLRQWWACTSSRSRVSCSRSSFEFQNRL